MGQQDKKKEKGSKTPAKRSLMEKRKDKQAKRDKK